MSEPNAMPGNRCRMPGKEAYWPPQVQGYMRYSQAMPFPFGSSAPINAGSTDDSSASCASYHVGKSPHDDGGAGAASSWLEVPVSATWTACSPAWATPIV